MHLLALMIELVSIKVAGKQIKKPIDIPRPGGKGSKKQERPQATPSAPVNEEGGRTKVRTPARPPSQQPSQQQQDAYSKGIAVLQSTSKGRR